MIEVTFGKKVIKFIQHWYIYIYIYIDQKASILKLATECKKQKGRKINDRQSFVNTYFVSISSGIESKIICMDKLTNHFIYSKKDNIQCIQQVKFNLRSFNKYKAQCKVIDGK